MKTNKLLAAGALALSMAMTPVASMLSAMPLTVLAAEDTQHTITISNPESGASYTAYQIFTGTIKDKTLGDIKWGSGISEAGKQAAYTKYSLTGEDQTAAKVAEKLTDQAAAREFAAAINNYLTSGTNSSTSGNSTTITVTGDGYYLIKDAAGSTANPTESILKVVGDVTVSPKTTDVPDYEKKVQENVKSVTDNPTIITGEKMNDVADYNIGDNVPFELAAVAPTESEISSYTEYKFVFHDKMDAGLTLNTDSIKVFVGDSTTPLNASDYILSTTPTDGDTFDVEVKIKGEGITGRAGKNIRVTFTATLNEQAKLDKVGNENSFVLEYSNNPTTGGTGKTQEDQVVVFTYHMDLTKVDNSETPQNVSGAEFQLYRMNGDTKEYLVADKDGTTGAYTVKEWTSVVASATTLSATQTDGNEFKINGLDDGTYYLHETKVPAGYNTPARDFELTLAAATKNNQNYAGTPANAIEDITLNNKVGNSAQIVNTKGTTLPETGGMGTTMIYGAGALLAAGAAVVYVTNKRTRKN